MSERIRTPIWVSNPIMPWSYRIHFVSQSGVDAFGIKLQQQAVNWPQPDFIRGRRLSWYILVTISLVRAGNSRHWDFLGTLSAACFRLLQLSRSSPDFICRGTWQVSISTDAARLVDLDVFALGIQITSHVLGHLLFPSSTLQASTFSCPSLLVVPPDNGFQEAACSMSQQPPKTLNLCFSPCVEGSSFSIAAVTSFISSTPLSTLLGTTIDFNTAKFEPNWSN